MHLDVSEVVFSPTLTLADLSVNSCQDTTKFAKFMIDKGIYNNPFKVFMDREHVGVVDFGGDGRDIE